MFAVLQSIANVAQFMVISACRLIVESTKPFVRWIDNFNKIYAVQMPSLQKGSFRSIMWMGVGVRVPRQPCVVQNLLVEPGKAAMPEDLFDPELKEHLVRVMGQVWNVANATTAAESLCTKYNINNIPLKPVVSRDEDPELHALLKSSPDGLANFKPEGVFPIHIGSNKGLAKEFRSIHNSCLADAPDNQHYRLMVADINIFMRTLKVSSFGVCMFLLFSCQLMKCTI